MRRSLRAFFCLVASLWAGAASAQYGQYTPPGGPEGRPVSRKEALEKALAAARLHLGALHVAPTFGIRDITYVSNVFATATGARSDLSGTAEAGARAYLRTGPQLIWSAFVLPDYIWWRHLSERRRLDQRFGAEVAGSFNRLEITAAASREEQQSVVTPELLVPVNVRDDHATATAELRLFSRLGAFVSGGIDRYTSLLRDDDPDAAAITQLDREERTERGGLRYHAATGWTVGLAGEHSQVTFLHGAANRGNSGNAPVLELRLDRPGYFAAVEAADRSLSASQGAAFAAFHKVTGRFDLGLNPAGRLEVSLYGGRNLVYSLLPGYSYLTDDRAGAALRLKLGWRTSARVFAEDGRDLYSAFSPLVPHRDDTVRSFGGGLRMDLRSVALSVQATHTSLGSNLPGQSRGYNSVSGGLSFTAN